MYGALRSLFRSLSRLTGQSARGGLCPLQAKRPGAGSAQIKKPAGGGQVHRLSSVEETLFSN